MSNTCFRVRRDEQVGPAGGRGGVAGSYAGWSAFSWVDVVAGVEHVFFFPCCGVYSLFSFRFISSFVLYFLVLIWSSLIFFRMFIFFCVDFKGVFQQVLILLLFIITIIGKFISFIVMFFLKFPNTISALRKLYFCI